MTERLNGTELLLQSTGSGVLGLHILRLVVSRLSSCGTWA